MSKARIDGMEARAVRTWKRRLARWRRFAAWRPPESPRERGTRLEWLTWAVAEAGRDLTSNRDRSQWPELLGEALLASAALDRLTPGAYSVEITAPSLRAEHSKKQVANHRARGGQPKAGDRRHPVCGRSGHAAALAPHG